MNDSSQRIVIVERDAAVGAELQGAMEEAGFTARSFEAARDAVEDLKQSGADVFLFDVSRGDENALDLIAGIRGNPATESTRVMLLTGAEARQRTTGLELGANDAVSLPCDMGELLARVREQCRVRRNEEQLRDRARLAEEGQKVAYTAFDAVAVTEKMTQDASRLDRKLSLGLGAFFVVVTLMAATYFLLAHKVQLDNLRSVKILNRLSGGLVHQQDLLAEIRKRRTPQTQELEATVGNHAPQGEALKKQADDIKAKIATSASDPAEVSSLRKQLQETNDRLKKVEQQGSAAQGIILSDVPSVCLLHVSVAFRQQQSGKRLRFAGLNSQDEPLQDSEGHPILTVDGTGPEVKFDVFGTGFIVGPKGLVVTNRHVAEPWWKNDDLNEMTSQGFLAEISLIRAYFPGDSRAFHAEIETVSKTTDLATMRVDLQDLERPILSGDASTAGAKSGESVVLMGYATGLEAILARADEDTTQKILTHSGGEVSHVLQELAQRGLIRPIITQGHIGDVLPDKIVFDAQTTHGGSGGPLFNDQGKVVGITYAGLDGFGGSNLAIPIRLSEPLLAKQ